MNLELWYDYGAVGYLYRFTKELYSTRTPNQIIRVLEHEQFGKCLVCDGDIMSCEDDSAYDNAIIALLPEKRRRVLILGGGDCSLAAELQKDPAVESIVIAEIDTQVPVVAKHYLGIQLGSKVSFVFGDAAELPYAEYDVVIDDLFTVPLNSEGGHYETVAKRFGCPVISQIDSGARAEGNWKQILKFCPEAQKSTTYVPVYLEQWNFALYHYANR
jgi:spermidine synthase